MRNISNIILVYYPLLSLILVLSSCKEEEFTGSAKLIFSGVNIQDLEIDVYPDHIFKIEDLIEIEPLLKGLKPNQYGEVIIEGLNAGNYVWYDRGNNRGVFQISPNEERTYQINL